MKKKILSGLLIVAFVFGLGAADIQPVSAAASNEIKETKDKFDRNSDKSNRPEPPKDKDGNPIVPPDRNNGDKSDRPEPPKDKDGNPIAPPNKNK